MSTEQERQRLREVAQGAVFTPEVRATLDAAHAHGLRVDRFHNECDPPTVLALLDELEAAQIKAEKFAESLLTSKFTILTELESTRDEQRARAEAAEGVVAKVREVAEDEARLASVTTGTDHSYWHGRTSKLISRALSDPTPEVAPESGDGVNGAPGRHNASPGGTSGANDAGGIREGE